MSNSFWVKAVYSVVIPAYNEEGRIERTLRAYAAAFSDSEIIVVANGCTDRTADRARALALRNPNIRLVEFADPLGKGGALIAGLASAHADVVAFTDADGATDPDELRRLCGLVGPHDAVVASRWLPGADVMVPQPLPRRAASRVFNRLVRMLFGLGVSDTQCGAKAFRAEALAPVLLEVETADYAFDVDVLVALARRRCSILEVPIRWRDVDGSKVQLAQGAIKMLFAVLRLRLRHSRYHMAVPAFDAVFRTRGLRAPMPDSGV
jgi:glycosyltransferase involved in cell wall biosynthesis